MPEITSEKRDWINVRLARRREIEDLFTERNYTSQHCHLCNWASNGLGIDLAVKENEAHQWTHPEFAEWASLEIHQEEMDRLNEAIAQEEWEQICSHYRRARSR